MRKVLDIFCGMGGFSLGFARLSFVVKGFDIDHHCIETFKANVGTAKPLDLRAGVPKERTTVLLAGPPCKPWSRLNVNKTRVEHPDRPLINAVRTAVLKTRPAIFVVENVPLLARDSLFEVLKNDAADAGYDIESEIVRYSDYGAATSRRRLFLFGVRRGRASDLLAKLEALKSPALTVSHALTPFLNVPQRAFPDHTWPQLRTINRYAEKYEKGRYGWYRLAPDAPAPSFGNINKTYTLHPFSYDGAGPRVLSPREAMAIMGFDLGYRFPESVPQTAKYKMIADSVSPTFSAKLAQAVTNFLGR
jgi:DNA (cytosine-5)-methyltransferase 1